MKIVSVFIIGATANSGSNKTPTNTYQAPKPATTPPPSHNYNPIQIVPRQTIVKREITPEDAYSEGYDEGYEQGKSDGIKEGLYFNKDFKN